MGGKNALLLRIEREKTAAALDAKLKQIFGPDFHPWEQRYS